MGLPRILRHAHRAPGDLLTGDTMLTRSLALPRLRRPLPQDRLPQDRLPANPPWWGVILARVITRLAWGLAIAIAAGRCPGKQPKPIRLLGSWLSLAMPNTKPKLPERGPHRLPERQQGRRRNARRRDLAARLRTSIQRGRGSSSAQVRHCVAIARLRGTR